MGGRAVRAPDTRARAAHWALPPPQPAATAAEEQLNFEAIAASDPEMSVLKPLGKRVGAQLPDGLPT